MTGDTDTQAGAIQRATATAEIEPQLIVHQPLHRAGYLRSAPFAIWPSPSLPARVAPGVVGSRGVNPRAAAVTPGRRNEISRRRLYHCAEACKQVGSSA